MDQSIEETSRRITHRIPNQWSMQHGHWIQSDSEASNTIISSRFQPCSKKFLNLFNIAIYLLFMLFNQSIRAGRRKKRPKKPVYSNFSFWNGVFRKKPSSRVWSNTGRIVGGDTFSEYPTTFLSTQQWKSI